MRKLSLDQINYLNVGLILLSCVAAFLWPFELFLLAYAVLGPLHYLTEISWLHDKNYFTHAGRANHPWLLLVGATMLVVLYGIIAASAQPGTADPRWEIALFYLVFVTAIAAALKMGRNFKILLLLTALILLLAFSSWRYYAVIAFFLITIIHVFVFTSAFILHGALKSRSLSALLSLGVFLVCAASFFVFVPEAGSYTISEYVRGSYSSFNALNAELIRLLGLGQGRTASEIYESGTGLAVMRFIAFAYTYHYLNWFSKTSVIRWHKAARRRVVMISALWACALALYARNYETGMTVLYSLSILHVMLEFPLNHQTFLGITKETRALLRPQPSPMAQPLSKEKNLKKKGTRVAAKQTN
ncbi:MAG TPA: hypothetical protein VF717_15350 [Pyrinomonadaceae bacterium]|jgi:hypothetical protein